MGSGCIAPLFLNSAPDRGEWSVPRPGRIFQEEIAPGTYWLRGGVGPSQSEHCGGVKNIEILGNAKPDTENIRGLNLTAVKCTTAQVTRLPL
jgi:hypothetical protein